MRNVVNFLHHPSNLLKRALSWQSLETRTGTQVTALGMHAAFWYLVMPVRPTDRDVSIRRKPGDTLGTRYIIPGKLGHQTKTKPVYRYSSSRFVETSMQLTSDYFETSIIHCT